MELQTRESYRAISRPQRCAALNDKQVWYLGETKKPKPCCDSFFWNLSKKKTQRNLGFRVTTQGLTIHRDQKLLVVFRILHLVIDKLHGFDWIHIS